MYKVRNTIFTKLLVVATLALFLVAKHPGVLASAEAVKATTSFKHKPLKHFVAGHRIQVEAKVTDSQGVSLVRCYFRAAGQADFVFVGMKAGEQDTFTGILPAPAAETKSIEYLFLAVNGKNQVVKTQAFRTELKAVADIPDWQKSGGEGQVAVSSELAQAAAPLGFTDSIALNVVESSLRFGYVAGIYNTTQVAVGGGSTGAATSGGSAATVGATGAATTAVSAGTVAASAGISTTVIVGASAAVAAVGVGVAASGGSGDSTGDNGSSDAPLDLTGNWQFCNYSCGYTAEIKQSGSNVDFYFQNQGSDGIPGYGVGTGSIGTHFTAILNGQSLTVPAYIQTTAFDCSSNHASSDLVYPTWTGAGTASQSRIDLALSAAGSCWNDYSFTFVFTR